MKEGGKLAGDSDHTEPSGPRTMRGHASESLGHLAPHAKSAVTGERQPFINGVGFRKPHPPFSAPKRYWELYDRSPIPRPYPDKARHVPEVALINWLELRTRSDRPDFGLSDTEKTRELIYGYYACVSVVDAQTIALTESVDLYPTLAEF